jgi:hypothetical protein
MRVGHGVLTRAASRVARVEANDDGRRSSSGRYNGTNEEGQNRSARSRVAPSVGLGAALDLRTAARFRDWPHVRKLLPRPDDDDTPPGVIHDVRRDAAQKQTSDRTTTMAADDDDVRVFRIGSLDHQRSGVALPNEVLGRDPRLSRARDDPRNGRLTLASNLVDPSVK